MMYCPHCGGTNCEAGMCVGTPPDPRDAEIAALRKQLADALANSGAVVAWEPVALPAVSLCGFPRAELEQVAESLEAEPQRIGVGNVTGMGDEFVPTAAAEAARFIRTVLQSDSGAVVEILREPTSAMFQAMQDAFTSLDDWSFPDLWRAGWDAATKASRAEGEG